MSRVKRSWLVGGEQEVQDAIDGLLLAGQGARVLIHGSPGMGKDVVASEVVRDPRITNCPGVHYQKWLVASTDTVLRAQLIVFFQTHLPQVVQGCSGADKEGEALLRIRG